MDTEPSLEFGDWQPHHVQDFPAWQQPTIELLNLFDAALFVGRVPTRCYRGHGADYETRQVEITIFPDDAGFRAAVAEAMPADSYRIQVDDVRHIAT